MKNKTQTHLFSLVIITIMLLSLTPLGVVAQNPSTDINDDPISLMGTKTDPMLSASDTGIILTEKAKDYGINEVVPAFGLHVFPFPVGFYKWPDVSQPGDWELISPISDPKIHAGDFLGSDFSKLYAISNESKELFTISSADGSIETIATLTPPEGTLSGLAGAEGFFYGIVTNCINQTTLYKLNLAGEIEVLGIVPNVSCGIDLAYIPSEKMIYIVNLLGRTLHKVDPSNPAGAVKVGEGLGYPAKYPQGMDYDEENGILYWAACSDADFAELRIINTETGSSEKVGDFPSGEVTVFAIAAVARDMQHQIHFPMIHRD